MWNYEKRLEYPVNITQTNPQIAQVIISQFGGPDGELAASMRYLSQRYTMPYKEAAGVLTDIGIEASEMALFKANAFFASVCGDASGEHFSASVSKAPVTPYAPVKLHLCGSIFK